MGGDQSAITDFSSVADTSEDFISAIETDEFSLWDVVGEDFTPQPTPGAASTDIITIRFTDAPTKLGRSRKVIPEGTGMLFPELMGG